LVTSDTGALGAQHAQRFALRTGGEAKTLITGGFWAARQRLNRRVSIPDGYRSLEKAGSLKNLALVPAGASGGHSGPYFVDSDVYKWLEAVAWELDRLDDGDDGFRSDADQAIALVQKAQDPDGYIIEVGQTTDPHGDWWPADWLSTDPDGQPD
jgi:uncharacterized protein